tara:strand:- start:675 stop:782 length:108 start_codon:yes stop_codon:yes gene_type:complete
MQLRSFGKHVSVVMAFQTLYLINLRGALALVQFNI